MGFKNAVCTTMELSNAYFLGIQALAKIDRKRVRCKDTRRLTGSVNLEKSLRGQYPGEPIWDYGIGWRVLRKSECAIWIEVHSADSNHVVDVINKVRWLKNWLLGKAPTLNALTHEKGYVWIASGRVSLSRTSCQARQLAKEGISFPIEEFVIEIYDRT
jgi:hypothetical protein